MLKETDTLSKLRTELNLSNFYTSNVNLSRSCSALSTTSMQNLKNELAAFLTSVALSSLDKHLDFSIVITNDQF